MHSTIQFYFALDKGRLEVLLEADVEPDNQGIFYEVKKFRLPGSSSTGILPGLKIRRLDGHWVHGDSGWHTELSEAVGKAIDKAGIVPARGCVRELQSGEGNGENAGTAEGAA